MRDAELCKGSTADSDSVCLGSNPSSAATKASNFYSGLEFFRGVAQFGSALRSGRRSRKFESCHLDQNKKTHRLESYSKGQFFRRIWHSPFGLCLFPLFKRISAVYHAFLPLPQ